MIDLSRYIPRENILRVTARHHDDILRELLQPCFRDLPEKERLPLMDELLHSDAMKDQAMGNGFAITHTRRDGQANIRVAVGLLTPPTPFRRGPAVHTVFCAVIPIEKSREYLGFLSRLSRMLAEPRMVEAFRAGDVDGLVRGLSDYSK